MRREFLKPTLKTGLLVFSDNSSDKESSIGGANGSTSNWTLAYEMEQNSQA